MNSKEPYMKMLQSRFRNMFTFYGCKPIYIDTDSIKIEPCNVGKTYKEKQRLNAMYGKRLCDQVNDRMFTVKDFKRRIENALYADFFPQMKVSVEVIDYSLCMYNVEVEFYYKGWYNSVNRTCNGLTFCSLYSVYDNLIGDIEKHLKECDEEWKTTEH